nr:Uncharacterised protein [Klebsiella pneumoniae]
MGCFTQRPGRTPRRINQIDGTTARCVTWRLYLSGDCYWRPVKSIGGLALRLTGIPALFGIVKGGIAALSGGLSMLLSPIGLVGAAFVAAGVLIWKYWGPIKAFFSGFTGVIRG